MAAAHDGGDGGGGGGGGGGRLVKVAFARNQAEAEMIQGLLWEAGIPSVLKRSGGFDAPEFLAAGPRDVMVNTEAGPTRPRGPRRHHGRERGRGAAELIGESKLRRGETKETTPARLALWVGAAFLAAVVLVWILYQLS